MTSYCLDCKGLKPNCLFSRSQFMNNTRMNRRCRECSEVKLDNERESGKNSYMGNIENEFPPWWCRECVFGEECGDCYEIFLKLKQLRKNLF